MYLFCNDFEIKWKYFSLKIFTSFIIILCNFSTALSSDDEAPEERYYGESSLASLKLLEQRLEKDPSNEQLRIEFATAFCNQPAKDVATKTKKYDHGVFSISLTPFTFIEMIIQ